MSKIEIRPSFFMLSLLQVFNLIVVWMLILVPDEFFGDRLWRF